MPHKSDTHIHTGKDQTKKTNHNMYYTTNNPIFLKYRDNTALACKLRWVEV